MALAPVHSFTSGAGCRRRHRSRSAPNTMTIRYCINSAPINTVPGPQSTDEDVAWSSPAAMATDFRCRLMLWKPDQDHLDGNERSITLSTTADYCHHCDGTADATWYSRPLTAVNTALKGMSFTPQQTSAVRLRSRIIHKSGQHGMAVP